MVAALAAAGASAQDNSVIGPPQLKDFQLPGQRTSPPRPIGPVDEDSTPATTSPPPRQTPPPIIVPSAPPVTSSKTNAQPSTQSSAAEPSADAPAPRAAAPATPRSAAPQTPEQAPAAAPALPPAAFTPSTEGSGPPAPAGTTPETTEAPPSGWNPFWLALPLLLAALAGLAYWRRRRSAGDAFVRDEDADFASDPVAEPQLETPIVATRASRQTPTPRAAAQPAARAWLEVEFKPSRAAATDKETIVHYELVLRNVGSAPAANIRIDSKLFNAGAESDIKDFLGGAIHEHSGSPHVTIAPDAELRLGSTIAMSKEDVREIVIDGRSLFVPAVAVNVAYNWGADGAGAGRTSKSWLVGREAEQPSQKMGAFRLDLGPRIYRSVGQRQTGLAQMV